MAQEKIVIFHHDERGAVRTWSEVGELVRCKDCKFYVKNNPTVLCLRDSGNPEWFCADGKRRDTRE